MLTLFAIPKPFQGHTGVIQRNAIRSWRKMCPSCEIILFGDDEGTSEFAADLGVKHIGEIARNEFGTPLVNDLFEQAQRVARFDVLGYVNADIILMSDFLEAVGQVRSNRAEFLTVGRRWDVDIREPWDFDSTDWESRMRRLILEQGTIQSKAAIDYFVFSRGLLDAIPPFAIGRTAWDNWLIFRARERSSVVIDATKRVMAVHQNHEYTGFSGKTALWGGKEAGKNRMLMAEGFRNLDDVTHLLLPEGLRSAWSPRELFRHPRRLAGRYPALRRPIKLTGSILRGLRSTLSVLSIRENLPKMRKS